MKKQNDNTKSANNTVNTETVDKSVEIPHNVSVRQLSEMLKVTVVDIIKQLMRNGIMANINQVIDFEVAEKIAAFYGYKAQLKTQTVRKSASVISEIKRQQQLLTTETNLKPRPPVITIMGHVDHGKTRLLDAIRKTNVMDSEAGGITQHIGAYQVEINGQKITFLDTPGHEAFTAMRARGAQITDVTVLVVAADDGVQPQTLEAISHAKAAGVPIVVAINKIDKPEANPDFVKQQLAEAGLVVEEWGGDVIAVGTSAKAREGIQELLENLLLVAEMENLRADPTLPAKGVVIEAEMDKSKGPLTTVLVHDGTLKPGDMVVIGNTWGRVRAMFNDSGKQVRKAKPSTPVVLLGMHEVPQVGDTMTVVADEKQARNVAEENRKETAAAAKAANLSNLLDQVNAGTVKELNIVMKADVQGSVEPIKDSIERLQTDKVQVKLVHAGTGNVTETDVMLAVASQGLVVAFNTGVDVGAQRMADAEGVDIRTYKIIYDLIDDVEKALKGMLEPEYIEVIDGHAEVREVFSAGKKGGVAGSYVLDGKIKRGAKVRLKRGNKIVADTTISSLRRFKDDVKEVATGYECGITLDNYDKFQVGDIFECYSLERSK
ncbi:MAG TPA: translation initiation factor IF-2 [Dehalococcoidia bacterium]|nr:translation initiation factor IF-2 [Dehalococcoidia bacterium]